VYLQIPLCVDIIFVANFVYVGIIKIYSGIFEIG